MDAWKVFHTYYAIIGIMSTRCEVCYSTHVVYIKDMKVVVFLTTTLYIKLDLIGSYEGHWLFEGLHFVTVCLGHFQVKKLKTRTKMRKK